MRFPSRRISSNYRFLFSFTFLRFYLTSSLSSFSCTSLKRPQIPLFSSHLKMKEGEKEGQISFICWPHSLLLFTHSNQIPFLYTLRSCKEIQKTVLIHWPELPSATLCVSNIIFTFFRYQLVTWLELSVWFRRSYQTSRGFWVSGSHSNSLVGVETEDHYVSELAISDMYGLF